MKRADTHRPSAINPAEYEFVALGYQKIQHFGDCDVILAERKRFNRHKASHPGADWSRHEHGGNCDICGAGCVYDVIFYHAATNAYIRTGQDCANKLEMGGNFEARITQLRKGITDARDFHAGKMKAAALFTDAGIAAALEIPAKIEAARRAAEAHAEANNFDHLEDWAKGLRAELIIEDIYSKVVKYGNLSDKQASFVKKLLGDIENRPAIEAERAAKRALAADCPTGRVTITGKIVGRKMVEDRFSRQGGEKCNWIIEAKEGFKVYGSAFLLSASTDELRGGEVGEEVTFVATVTPSQNDAKFGYYKRPALPAGPKPELTTEQKAAKKAIAKLRRVAKILPKYARDLQSGACWPESNDKYAYTDYEAFTTIQRLANEIEKEAGL